MAPPAERKDFEKDLEQCQESHKKAVSKLRRPKCNLIVQKICLVYDDDVDGDDDCVLLDADKHWVVESIPGAQT